MLYSDLKRQVVVNQRYTIVFRSRNSGEFETLDGVRCVNVYAKKALATFEQRNGVKVSVRFISIITLNGERVYL